MCDCIYHRYHVVHVCPCGQLISHSQSAWDAHRLHQGEWVTLDSSKFEHIDTAEDVKRKANESKP